MIDPQQAIHDLQVTWWQGFAAGFLFCSILWAMSTLKRIRAEEKRARRQHERS